MAQTIATYTFKKAAAKTVVDAVYSVYAFAVRLSWYATATAA